ncbi:hypothetical protein [Halalkalicoccus salilacus]|uniref:hypothetical protein n=1 Tax=Halalkalicoccus salilacus TaxID=3117459 RepID=UPI00300E7CD1
MSQSDELTQPADTMQERTGESGVKMWFLITANRWIVTGVLSLAMFGLVVLFNVVGPTNVQTILGPQVVGNVFGSVIIAVVTGVSLILAIAQLVLSEQMGPLGEKQDEMRDQIEFRDNVEKRIDDDVSPAAPSAFLRTLIGAVSSQARTFKDIVEDNDNDNDVDTYALVEYAESIIDHGETVGEELENTTFGSFEVIMPVLDYNYSWKIVAGRRLKAEYAGSITEEAEEALEELIGSLRFFAPAREYFKMIYFQWEINNIARGVLYASIPSLAIAAYMILAFDPHQVSGYTLALHNRYLFVGLVYTVSLLPFTVVLAYILRIVTVTQRTLALGPFILRETQRESEFD